MKYAAFTHCWGPEMPEAGMTKQENLESHIHKIDFSNLPKSFRDAILVAKSLGIRYIWIDSLCIIQNSIDDWEFESAQMGLVYSYAWCTIAASSAKNCHEGMHLFRKETEATCELIAQDLGAHRVQRGWTFQERELSPRVLHFSADQIWWECRTLRKQEDPLSDDIPLSSRLQRRNTSILHKFVVTEARYNTWHRIIEDYSTRAFSRITDRFPALSGLASEMQAAHGGEYVAGAWRDDLLRSLLWRRDPRAIAPPHSTIRRPPEYRAPSWSWAAIDEAVTYDLITLHRSQIDKTASTTAHIEAVNLVPNGFDPKGQLKDGFICMRGKLKMHNFSNMSRDIKFHMDFELASDVDDEISVAPLFLLSLFARTAMIEMQQPLFSLNVTGWALVLVMVVEDPEPIFRRVGVASDVVCEWFEDAMNVMIKII
ncbi:heterokaryon incompatibility protein-domain-containing protein [Leptodontidium sp. 2 PMI_412]|nr:heterokaryon incompatibility protein-domain-containing protein [Leptodontidium sp. 2 PMI_412]